MADENRKSMGLSSNSEKSDVKEDAGMNHVGMHGGRVERRENI